MAPKKPKKKLSAYNIHVKKQRLAGKSMKQAAASWNKKAGKPKAKAAKSTPKSKPKGGNQRMGKNGFNTQKIFKYVRLGALGLPAVQTLLSPMSTPNKISQLKSDYFGIDSAGNFSLQRLGKGWLPFLAATAVTYGIPKIAGMIRGFGK